MQCLRCFYYPCEIILSHIPVPAHRKDKKQTAPCMPHASHALIHDVIIMLKCHHNVASQCIQEAFFMFFQKIEVFSGEQEKQFIICARMG